jgi:predicted naringenin-chalcone synthase
VSAALLGIGTATPRGSVSQQRAAELAAAYAPGGSDQQRLLKVLYRRTGVERRGSVVLGGTPDAPAPGPLFPLPSDDGDRGPGTRARMEVYEREAPALALAAASAALTDADVQSERISHLVVVTCTGFVAPGLDVWLVRKLGLPSSTARVQVGFMGCHGAFVGLRTAGALAATDADARVLMVAVELCSLHFQYGWEPEQVVANALFADGAAAAVIGPEQAVAGALRLAAHGSWLAPGTEDAMTWRIGDRGFEMTLSAEVPLRIRESLREQVAPWLEANGQTLEGIRSWAIHPGGSRIVTAVGQALGLVPAALEASRSVLAQHGNMSSPTILFVLDRLRREDAPRPWGAVAFGPGLTTEAMLLY